MTSYRRIAMALSLAALVGSVAWAAGSVRGFGGPGSRGIELPSSYNAYHFKDKADSSIGWMHLIFLEDGGWIQILFGLANMGPYKKAPSVLAIYAGPDGTKYRCYEQWSGADHFVEPPPNKYAIQIDKSSFGGRYPNFYAKINNGGCRGEITFTSEVPSYTQGRGIATFTEVGGEAYEWRATMLSPRAKARGYLEFPERRITIEGEAYLEEVSGDLAIPSLADRFYIFHAINGPYSIHLFDIVVDKKNFGNGHVRMFNVTKDDKIIMGTPNVHFTPKGGRRHPKSGISVPTHFDLSARDGSTRLTGTVKMVRILEAVDILSQTPRFIRMFGSFIAGTPWHFKVMANYDLVLKEGENDIPLTGTGYEEIHFYDR